MQKIKLCIFICSVKYLKRLQWVTMELRPSIRKSLERKALLKWETHDTGCVRWRERNQLRNSSANYTHLEYTVLIVLIKFFNTEHDVPALQLQFCLDLSCSPDTRYLSHPAEKIVFIRALQVSKVAQNAPSQIKSVRMGRKAEVEALLPLKQAWQPSKSQLGDKSAAHLPTLGISHFNCQLYVMVA